MTRAVDLVPQVFRPRLARWYLRALTWTTKDRHGNARPLTASELRAVRMVREWRAGIRR